MKYSYFLLLCLLFSANCIAQQTRFNYQDSNKAADVKYIEYSLNNSVKSDLDTKLPFDKILFFDERYDTSYVSINWQNNSIGRYVSNRKLNLTNGLTSSLTNYFNSFFEKQFAANNAEFLCYVKKFSVTPTLIINSTYNDPLESVNKVKFEVECYYNTDGRLYPAIRIDTTYEIRFREMKKRFDEDIIDVVQPLIEKIAVIDTAKIKKRNTYTLQQIQDRYANRFNIPILTTNNYNKGVYKNFNEFLTNTPSIKIFSTKSNGISFTLYDSSGSEISSQIFGFCDGKNCWIYSYEFCSQLIKIGNSFECFYSLFSFNAKTNTYTNLKKYLMALNMENGSRE